MSEPTLHTMTGKVVPQLAFGTYKIPPDGDEIILRAIENGYRHFDTASYYGNEATLGRAIQKSGLPRSNFYICTKVWNDAQKGGREAVRESVENSLRELQSEFVDLILIHWPVPGYFLETYKELELLHAEGKTKSIGLSNFVPSEYETLINGGIHVLPEVNQFEISPLMYREEDILFFKSRKILVSASKALNRGGKAFQNEPIFRLAEKYEVTEAQIMLRWGLQKGYIVVAKTSTPSRMVENRNLTSFSLTNNEIQELDQLTTAKAVEEREVLEQRRKLEM
mmetsp:Transcript_3019/g.4452  ORF Transcript_3019/g.4452 Transcript_3019/m.4452 type:complete len:281 (-) Transcript_3019:1596-2438(-)